MDFRWGLALCVIGIVFGEKPALAQSTVPATAQRPVIRAGDTWTYAITHSISGSEPNSQFTMTVSQVTGNQITAEWQNPTLGQSGTFLFDSDLNLIQNTRAPALVLYHASPAFPGYQWPLYIGESWERSFQYAVPSRQYQASLAANVAAFEKVTVPAGTFDTFKITRTLRYMGSTATNSWSGSEQLNSWYAPSVKTYVKSEITDFGFQRSGTDTVTRELMSYKVQ